MARPKSGITKEQITINLRNKQKLQDIAFYTKSKCGDIVDDLLDGYNDYPIKMRKLK